MIASILTAVLLSQTLFDGGAPALPGTKVDAHPRTLPLQNVVTAADTNSIVTNLQMVENALLGDAGFPAYSSLTSGQSSTFGVCQGLNGVAVDGGTLYPCVNGAVGTAGDPFGSANITQLDAGSVLAQSVKQAGIPDLVITFNGGSANTTINAVEQGRDAFSGGVRTETLHFSSGTPACGCSDGAGSAAACGYGGTLNNTTVTFVGTNTNAFSWWCYGIK